MPLHMTKLCIIRKISINVAGLRTYAHESVSLRIVLTDDVHTAVYFLQVTELFKSLSSELVSG